MVEEVLEEDHHHVLVSVRLGQRVVDPALSVQSCDQGNPVADRLVWYRCQRPRWRPGTAVEVRRVNPRFVNVQDCGAVLE